MAELSALEDKFEAWTDERPTEELNQIIKKRTNAKAKTVSQRLYSAGRSDSQSRGQASDLPETVYSQKAEDPAQEIKSRMDKIDCKILQNGGPNCGWDAPDHKDFLRIRTKYKSGSVTLAFLNDMRRAVPNADEISVREHVRAYQKYIDLTEEKKDLI